LTGAAGFEVAGLLAGPYLGDHGATSEQVASFFGLGAVGAPLLGGLIGGIVSDRWGRHRSVALFLVGFSLLVLLLAWADTWSPGPSLTLLMVIWVGLYFFIGLFTASSYALFMALTDPKLGATQFSTFMAATNGCESWSGRAGGALAERGGYALGFAAMSLVSLASLIFLRRLGSSATEPQTRRQL
jgi:MFS family permease